MYAPIFMDGPNTEVLIGLGLFVVSELIGMSKMRENSVLQLLLAAARRAFPYDVTVQPHNDKQNRRRNRR